VRTDLPKESGWRIKLTKTVRDFSGSPFPKGSVLKAQISPEGKLKVDGAQHLMLHPHEWEPVLTEEDLRRLLNG
jgi:hypothetical protein